MPPTRVAAQPHPATTMRASLAQQIAAGSPLRTQLANVNSDRTGANPANITQVNAQLAHLQAAVALLAVAVLELARLQIGATNAAD